ncbi:MAG: D-alanyl-D-alanine-carboxypeptidase/endopeptidase AmpH [Alphaproteobacteria bacterium]|nr:D-alanyl-D-alanine-carboxypeptidase/endopeptidase AmpH [Alphaproteobacteria bacterium]
MIKQLIQACAFAIVLTPPSLANEAMPERQVQQLATIFRQARAPGMVAVIVNGERSYFAAFGQAKADRAAAPTPTSLLRLNSLSKLMAGEILAGLVAHNRLALDRPLQQFAPPGRKVPAFRRARAITLRDLLTHVSGLPRDLPSSLAQVTLGERWHWLERLRPLRAPGHTAQYSNAAYMFLGDALVAETGTRYEALLSAHVTAPLSLRDTTLAPAAEQCARLMSGGQPDDRACTPAFETAATAGVYSTAQDMAHWMRARLNVDAPSLAPIVNRSELKRLIAMDMAGRIEAIGFGWLHMRLGTLRVIQKTGGGGGFMNYVILAPSRKLGIFITVTRTDIEMLRRITAQTNALMTELAAAPLQP